MFVLGPESVISKKVVDQLKKRKLARDVNRIEGPNPVENAIAFARYEKGDFGWGVVVPGYNFTLASTRARPTPPRPPRSRRAACSRRSCSPTTRRALPQKLEEYFLSVQPGYEDDPGQAVYNRAWILGDDKAISVDQQAQLDQLTELIPVQSNAP